MGEVLFILGHEVLLLGAVALLGQFLVLETGVLVADELVEFEYLGVLGLHLDEQFLDLLFILVDLALVVLGVVVAGLETLVPQTLYLGLLLLQVLGQYLELDFHLFVDEGDVVELLLQGGVVVLVLALEVGQEVLVLDLFVVHLGLEVHVVVDLVLQLVLAPQLLIAHPVLEFGVLQNEFLDFLVGHRGIAILHDVLYWRVSHCGGAGGGDLLGGIGAVLTIGLGGVEGGGLLVVHHRVTRSTHSELFGLLLHLILILYIYWAVMSSMFLFCHAYIICQLPVTFIL